MSRPGTTASQGVFRGLWRAARAGVACAVLSGLTAELRADELPALVAVRRATAVTVRGWGPRVPMQAGVASYGFGQVVDTPPVLRVEGLPEGASAQVVLGSSGLAALPGALVELGTVSSDTDNFISLEVAAATAARGTAAADFADSFSTVAIACGEFHTLLLKRDGTVVGRGWDGLGQASVPQGLGQVVSIACGLDHSIAVRADGTAVLWGRNDVRQAEVAAEENHGFVAAAGGLLHTILLRGDGTVHVTHPAFRPETYRIPAPGDVVAVAAGASHSVLLHADGRVTAFGRGAAVLAPVPAEARDVVAVAAGGFFTVALRGDGRVVAWGDNTHGQTNVPPSATNVVSVAAGSFHALALRSDGTVVAWGEGSNGALSVPPLLRDVVAVSAGGYHSQVLVRTGPAMEAPRRDEAGWVSDLFLPAGTRFRLEASEDLKTWRPVGERRSQPGGLVVPLEVTGERGFLRVVPWVGARGTVESR